jgi:predicted molibdopterin-dependent oxidoreductase YjgC
VGKLTIDGKTVTCADGATLLEVCKDAGAYMSCLCYIDGLPPYAGCRTCLVEVEGGRGLQLSCTTKVTDGMVVRTTTSEVREGRKAVLSIILANHSDRCLTCHRREHCHPGDVCLRDDVVTHRCLTCPKNYRCELQATCEMVGMSQYEPWEGEARSFYALPEHPPADRANPFLEFDPKMCIICTRCVRACDELRHTGAITLAGRGFSTRIAFGAGGRIDESNCDFCGACIDVCPTATLLESPHKWTSRPDKWVETVCPYCSVGCTIKLGVKDGRGVMVRPSKINPVSWDQICIRGRYHYDALRARDYLRGPLVRRGDVMAPVSWEEALTSVAEQFARVVSANGPESVGVLAGPMLVTEEAYLAQKLARTALGTNNIDFTSGAVARATGAAVRGAFGTEVLPADMTDFRTATHIVVVGDDLEAAHPVAALRLKDAVIYNKAKAVVVQTKWGEMCDFTEAWLRPAPGREVETLSALTAAVLADPARRQALQQAGVGGLDRAGGAPAMPAMEGFDEAVAILKEAAEQGEQAKVAVVFAPTHLNAWLNGEIAKAAANLTIAACGPERAPRSLFIMPTEINVHGLRDVGVAPDLLPGYHPHEDTAYRGSLEQAWGAKLPTTAGLGFAEMMESARQGRLKALLVVGDNPLLTAPDKAGVRAALESLDLLVVIDSIMTDTAELAHIVLPDVDVYGKDGAYTAADRRVLRRNAATAPRAQARPALATLAELGTKLAAARKTSAAFPATTNAVMAEIAAVVPLYAGNRYDLMLREERQALFNGAVPVARGPQLIQIGDLTAATSPRESRTGETDALGLALLIGRTQYTSVEAAALHKKDADKLHREETVEISLEDADRLGIADGDPVTLQTDRGEMRVRAHLTDVVPEGAVFVSLLYDGGAVTGLLGPDDGPSGPVQVRVRVMQPA